MIPSLVLAFEVKLNKETNFHCWQPQALGQRKNQPPSSGKSVNADVQTWEQRMNNQIIPRNPSWSPLLEEKSCSNANDNAAKITISMPYALWFRHSSGGGSYFIVQPLRKGQKVLPDTCLFLMWLWKTKKQAKKIIVKACPYHYKVHFQFHLLCTGFSQQFLHIPIPTLELLTLICLGVEWRLLVKWTPIPPLVSSCPQTILRNNLASRARVSSSFHIWC